ncbi:hypothetical protein [Undibacterium flavidum]|uniref:Uncharacterized protein n=1 Tax=Undibacterium flavidum TaxID=2762297 RepID=A0ABR6YAT5_9BURK|nr:hypothetical protein [Undibacterium flavidum]MBC3873739.1 hypothetical protein [Undibacterium flavidum]
MEIHIFIWYLGFATGLLHLLICHRFNVRPNIALIYIPGISWLLNQFIPDHQASILEICAWILASITMVFFVCYLLRKKDS